MTPAQPWTLEFYDGNGNGYTFSHPDKAKPASFDFDPLTPEESSSGHYSGGTPASGSLSSEQLSSLWSWVHLFQNDESLQCEQRPKGTGCFVIKKADAKSEFYVGRGEKLDEYMSFLGELVGS
ncbi:MAG: hypothetical protein P1V97_36535 [Planctomycetota bacterium]|nr:hypothetical protein [Planctomycetota bacterium]